MSNGADGQRFSDISATTSAFTLAGGRYDVQVTATFGGGSVTLQSLSVDGSTWFTALTAFTAAGRASADLAPGQYRFAVATASAVYASIAAVPYA